MTRRNTSFARGPPPRRARGRYLKFRAACCSGNGRSDNGALRPTDEQTEDAESAPTLGPSPDALLPQLPEMSTQRSGNSQSASSPFAFTLGQVLNELTQCIQCA